MTVSHQIAELIVISGASTGMGAATARELARRGYHVLAGVRRESDGERLAGPGLEPVLLDITDPDQVAAIAQRVATDPQRRPLRALINNAGLAVNAPVEALPLDDWRRVFEVNLFGHIAMTQALLPALHESRGRVVNISSVGGRVSLAAYGAYAGSKFAMEAVSDALRRELGPRGVQVVVVEPGGVKTEMSNRGVANAAAIRDAMTEEHRRRYGDLMVAVMRHAEAFTEAGRPAEKAAEVIAKAATARCPRTRYTIGRDAAIFTRLSRVVPDRLLDRMTARQLRAHYPAATGGNAAR
ncbi:SDR family NAD(P)-dependent oxidoreductase [Nakamurella sp. YIM 132087]|uniref:SDR family NAD(P)-dependent oxidoreductase n=1 Tax=Nakamurella alba TaxID=2665158 RepID=A0A7K1FLC4_9ACTN|nr:SDR family oxidoreductase [Nakamurella alba]MTD14908.1 SDR family NAD(P)-dependent oxidoreductase [Nakamurella alba]